MSARASLSHCSEEHEWKQTSFHKLIIQWALSLWRLDHGGAVIVGPHLDPLIFFFFFFHKGNENSSFMWLIVSIRSFSNPSACCYSRFSPKTKCYEYFHISQGKSINYLPFFVSSHLPATLHSWRGKSRFPRFFLVGTCATTKQRGCSVLCYLADVWWTVLNDKWFRVDTWVMLKSSRLHVLNQERKPSALLAD